MISLNKVLKLPSIRAELDNWLIKQPWSGSSGFKNYYALDKLEKITIKLIENWHLSKEEALEIVTSSAEGIINEIYDIQPLNK